MVCYIRILAKKQKEVFMTASLTLSELNFNSMLKRSWEIFKENFVFIAASFLGLIVIQGVLSSFVGQVDENEYGTVAVANLISTIITQIISIGWMNVALRAVRNEYLEVSSFFEKAHLLIKYFLCNLLTGLLVVTGLILLIIPGFYFALKYAFATLLIVDKAVGPLQAMEMSAQMTKGFKGKLLLYWLGFVGVNILGLLALILGIFITIPLTSIATVVLYNALLEKIAENSTTASESIAPQSL